MTNLKELLRQQQEQIDYVIANQDTIRKQYGSDFIAVQDCQVIDHDKDENALYEKLRGKIKEDKFVLVYTLDEVLNPPINDMGGYSEEEIK